MKNAITYFLLCLFLSPTVYAKKETPLPVAKANIQFIENKGQVTDQHGTVRRDIDAKIEANGVVLFVGDGELHYQWQAPLYLSPKGRELNTSPTQAKTDTPSPPPGGGQPAPPRRGEGLIYRMDVKLVGANKNAEVIFEEPTGYYENYYLAHTGEDGVRANGYGRVIYKDIYPNIDLVLYTAGVSGASVHPPSPFGDTPFQGGILSGASVPPPSAKLTPPPAGDMHNVYSPLGEIEGQNSRGIKYDFIIHPGGNPADIKLRYEGATEVKLADGSLVATTPFGTITEDAPYSYEHTTQKEVRSAFILEGNELRFDIKKNKNETLVIDPAMFWATYYGGSGGDTGLAVATNNFDEVFICGSTSSSGNIATTGAFQTSVGNSFSGFVVKFNGLGQRQWGTYYGDSTRLQDIACDEDGNVYAAGETFGHGLASSGAHQTAKIPPGNYTDAILVKLGNNGQRQWATYYGGSGWEEGMNVTCDPQGNVIMGGATNSTTNIATPGAHDTLNTGSEDVFFAKFSNNGTRLWGTYYGEDVTSSNHSEKLFTLACDTQGSIFVGGHVQGSLTGGGHPIVTPGAHQVATTGPPAGRSAFLSKFSSTGVRQWGTLYGVGPSVITGIAIDNAGYVYVSGTYRDITATGNYDSFITTQGAHREKIINQYEDAYLAKFTNGGVRLWGAFYGGASKDYATGVTVNPAGTRLYLHGITESDTGIATTGAYRTSPTGGNNMFLAEFDSSGQWLWGSYYGGEGLLNPDNNYDYFGKSICTGCMGKMYMATSSASSSGIATSGSHQSSLSGTTDAVLAAFYTDTMVWIQQPFNDTLHCPGDTFKLPYGANLPFNSGNSFTVQLSDGNGSFSNPVAIGSKTATGADTVTCVIPLNTPAGNGYRIRLVSSSPERISCISKSMRVKPIPQNFSNANNTPICSGDTLHLTGSSTSTGITWAWTGPNNFSSSAKDSFIANAQVADSGDYILTATLDGCSIKDTTHATIKLTPAKPTAGSNSPVCEFYSVQLTTNSTTNGVSYTWAGPGSYSSSTQNPTVTTSATSSHAGDYTSTATLNGCSSRDTTTVVVLPKPSKPTAGAANSPLCARQDLQLTASSITGASYNWYGPSAFTANTQNPVRANVQMADAGAYYVYATVSGCVSDTDSVVVTVNTDPFVNVFPTPGATVCVGQQVIFTAVPTNGGTTSYNWLVNGISTGSMGLTYSSTTLNNGDAVSCAMTSTGTCATPFIDTSNAIIMTVQPILTPTVTMTADKMPPWNGGLTVTFTATPTHGGANPVYQWKRNGQDVQGATGANWGVIVNALNADEDICVVLKSSYQCALPDTAMSNCITTAFTGIVGEATNNGFKIYPNPVKDVLYIEAPLYLSPKGRGLHEVTVELVDVLGRKCAVSSPYPPKARPADPRQNESFGLAFGRGETRFVNVSHLVPGVYMVRVDGVVVGRVVKE